MTVRNLDAVFNPRSVALIGASARPGSVGAVVARNLAGGGFAGPVMLVNPRHKEIDGRPVYRDVAALPETPDLAVICTPPAAVPSLIDALGRRGSKGAVVITAGFGEGGDAAGLSLRQRMLDAARPHLLRIVGPNCVGIGVPGLGLDASFLARPARPGRLAVVSQSGAILAGIVDWAAARAVGFSHLVSVGSMADVDFGDMLDYLAADRGTDMLNVVSARVFHIRHSGHWPAHLTL